MQKRWRKIGILLMVSLLSLVLVAGCGTQDSGDVSQGGKNKTVNIGYVTWAENIAVTNLWKEILETKGYEVKIQQLQASPLFVGLGKGNLDLFLDSWLPITHEAYWNQYKENLEDYGNWYDGEAKIGIVVPNYVTINTLSEMKANAAKFNGEIIGIDPGAGIMKASQAAIEDLELGVNLVQGSEAAMMAALGNAVKEDKWVAITGWSPHWMFAKHDLKYLKDDSPNQSFGEAEGLHTLANKNFAEKNPEVAKWMKNFKMNDQQIGSLEDLINQTPDDPQGAAREWIKANQDVVDSWLN